VEGVEGAGGGDIAVGASSAKVDGRYYAWDAREKRAGRKAGEKKGSITLPCPPARSRSTGHSHLIKTREGAERERATDGVDGTRRAPLRAIAGEAAIMTTITMVIAARFGPPTGMKLHGIARCDRPARGGRGERAPNRRRIRHAGVRHLAVDIDKLAMSTRVLSENDFSPLFLRARPVAVNTRARAHVRDN